MRDTTRRGRVARTWSFLRQMGQDLLSGGNEKWGMAGSPAVNAAAAFLLLWFSVALLLQLGTWVSARCIAPEEFGELSYLYHLLGMGGGGGKLLALLGLLIWIRGSQKKRAPVAA